MQKTNFHKKVQSAKFLVINLDFYDIFFLPLHRYNPNKIFAFLILYPFPSYLGYYGLIYEIGERCYILASLY